MFKQTLAAAALLSTSTSVFASASDDTNAHFKAIAAGNIEQIMQGYADNAALQWVGGPLNGIYAGSDKINKVRAKFAKGKAPLDAVAGKVEESSNPDGSTVPPMWNSRAKAPSRYAMLTYREGKPVNELWQIDAKLASC